MRYPIVELRQYTLHPGQRDVLIDLFDREFVETQEATGMTIIGQFRDLDAPDRFVWLRGFADMPSRAEALTRFYGGPVWKAHRDAANATMIDSDDVLLLRPVTAQTGFPAPAAPRPPVGHTATPSARLLATIDHRFDETLLDLTAPLACFQSEHAENTFPALPVRVGEDVFVSFARFDSEAELDAHLASADSDGAVRHLRLAPTARSLLR
jgi:hypothetical protein